MRAASRKLMQWRRKLMRFFSKLQVKRIKSYIYEMYLRVASERRAMLLLGCRSGRGDSREINVKGVYFLQADFPHD